MKSEHIGTMKPFLFAEIGPFGMQEAILFFFDPCAAISSPSYLVSEQGSEGSSSESESRKSLTLSLGKIRLGCQSRDSLFSKDMFKSLTIQGMIYGAEVSSSVSENSKSES